MKNLRKRTYRYAFMVQEKFKKIIGIQILSSTLVVCFILYELANTSLISSKFLEFVLYLACMMTQIFVYCWYGNQLKLKVKPRLKFVLVKIVRISRIQFNFIIHAQSVEVVDTIFELDWISLDNRSKKDLINIMRRAMNPIELTCAYIFTMDLRTFVSVSIDIKTILTFKKMFLFRFQYVHAFCRYWKCRTRRTISFRERRNRKLQGFD